ncbi:unnamed protein product [Chironomus riparius]|uniref:Uncharacterized protein n=1 Tax=Chironomus riparius TaxID=315576 RepID=A0A9N9S4U0_9DIPT|nr:unnamed protein product [Chironomus riparius]
MKLLIITFTLLIASCCCQDSFNSHTYPELQVDPKAYSDQLNEDGVWMKWNTTISGVPSNAVYGGYDLYGATYIIRADHTTPDAIYAGKIIGKYNPWQKMAYVGHNSHEFKKNDFEILTHERWVWTNKSDQRSKISGSNGFNICRIEVGTEGYMIPGKLDSDGRWCTVSYSGTEVLSSNYEVLCKTC